MSRRLGSLLALVEAEVDLASLRRVAQPDDGSPSELRAGNPRRGSIDPGWNLRINADVQPDV